MRSTYHYIPLKSLEDVKKWFAVYRTQKIVTKIKIYKESLKTYFEQKSFCPQGFGLGWGLREDIGDAETKFQRELSINDVTFVGLA